MTSHASFILAIVIGLFSVMSLYYQSTIEQHLRLVLIVFVYSPIASIGIYEIWRFKQYQEFAMALEKMVQNFGEWDPVKDKDIVDLMNKKAKEIRNTKPEHENLWIRFALVYLLGKPYVYGWYIGFILITLFLMLSSGVSLPRLC